MDYHFQLSVIKSTRGRQVVTGRTISVKVNDMVGPYIKSYKGVRQGDPLSLILFNFVAGCLTRLILKA